jgi:hypothetical protein
LSAETKTPRIITSVKLKLATVQQSDHHAEFAGRFFNPPFLNDDASLPRAFAVLPLRFLYLAQATLARDPSNNPGSA